MNNWNSSEEVGFEKALQWPVRKLIRNRQNALQQLRLPTARVKSGIGYVYTSRLKSGLRRIKRTVSYRKFSDHSIENQLKCTWPAPIECIQTVHKFN